MRILKTLFDVPLKGRRPAPESRLTRKAWLFKFARSREVCRDELMAFTADAMLATLGRLDHPRSCRR